MKNKLKVNIYNRTYNLLSEESQEYTNKLALVINSKIKGMMKALDCLDELSKANQNIENIRTQIKDYVDDAGRARSQADEAQKEIRELQAKVHDLEEQLEARTVVKREPEDEVINANELLSQEIKNAIERPVHPNQPNNGNFVGTVNYRPEGGSH